jgi:hypothetical protein
MKFKAIKDFIKMNIFQKVYRLLLPFQRKEALINALNDFWDVS